MITLVQTEQGPYIIGMPVGTDHGIGKTEIGLIGLKGLFNLSLLQQQRAQRVATGHHPAPGFIVGQ